MALGHGGAREGAGRPPKVGGDSLPRTGAKADFEFEKARHEKLKADERELELEIRRGNYLPRDVQRQASATALAVLTQSLRSVPDNLERMFSLPPPVVESIAIQIDSALAEVAQAFKAMTHDG